LPPEHVLFVPQSVAQLPQARGSVIGSRHAPEQLIRLAEQDAAQPEGVHTSVPVQAVHPPQLCGSKVSASQPFEGSPSQSAHPVSQEPIAHAPFAHVGVALGRTHGELHDPALQPKVGVSTSATERHAGPATAPPTNEHTICPVGHTPQGEIEPPASPPAVCASSLDSSGPSSAASTTLAASPTSFGKVASTEATEPSTPPSATGGRVSAPASTAAPPQSQAP